MREVCMPADEVMLSRHHLCTCVFVMRYNHPLEEYRCAIVAGRRCKCRSSCRAI